MLEVIAAYLCAIGQASAASRPEPWGRPSGLGGKPRTGWVGMGQFSRRQLPAFVLALVVSGLPILHTCWSEPPRVDSGGWLD